MSDPFEGIETAEPKKVKKRTKKQSNAETKLMDNHIKKMTEPDDLKERATLIYAIKAYGKSPRFKKYLKTQGKTFGESRLQKMNIEQLKLELETLDLLISNRGNSDFIDSVIKNGLVFAENIVDSRTKLKIRGTADELWENDKFLDLLERVKLKYGMPSLNLDPALELTFVVFQTAMLMRNQSSFRHNLIDDDLNLDEPVKITTKKDEPGPKDAK